MKQNRISLFSRTRKKWTAMAVVFTMLAVFTVGAPVFTLAEEDIASGGEALPDSVSESSEEEIPASETPQTESETEATEDTIADTDANTEPEGDSSADADTDTDETSLTDLLTQSITETQNSETPIPTGILPLATDPAVGTITATITNADNGAVSLGGASDSADFSFSAPGTYTKKIYDLRIDLTGMPTDKVKTLEVTLPLGMAFQYTNITTFLATQSQFASDLETSPAPAYAHVGLTSEAGYTFKNGKYTFTISPGKAATSVIIPITFDDVIHTDHITNAVQVSLTADGTTIEDTLEEVNITNFLNYNTFALHSDTNKVFYLQEDAPYLVSGAHAEVYVGWSQTVWANRLITGATITVHTTDPDVVIGNGAGGASNWSLDTSGAASGDYVFTYIGSSPQYSYKLTLYYTVTIPSAAGWTASDVATVYISAATVTYKQYDTTVSGNIGSSVSAGRATEANLTYGGNTNLANYGHRFKLAPPDEQVIVNYGSAQSFLDTDRSDRSRDITTSTNLNNADADPANNHAQGFLGYFYVINAGAQSVPKTVEMHFDSTTYGVMATRIPLPAGQNLTSIDYKTIADPGVWHTATVNLTGVAYDAVGDVGNYADISYETFGLGENDFITDLRYDAGVFPANQSFGYKDGGSYTQITFYGKWLDSTNASGVSAPSTIRIYDTGTGTPAHDTGVGIATVQLNGSQSGGVIAPNGSYNPIDVNTDAGGAINFSILYGSDMNDYQPVGKSNEAPIFYIRSEFKDETGAFLPITNIQLTNGTLRGNEDLTSQCTITHWEVDEDGDSVNDAVIYKIDTAGTKGKAQLMNHGLKTVGGVVINSSYSDLLTFSIQTTALTPTQEEPWRDMLFLRDPNASTYNAGIGKPTGAFTSTQDPALYGGLMHGETGGWLARNPASMQGKVKINAVQSILASSYIKHINGLTWLNYTGTPIEVGIMPSSAFQMKSTITNNAGTTVSGTEVYIPVPKAGVNWGGKFMSAAPQLSINLKGGATLTATGTVGTYDIHYHVASASEPATSSEATLQGYTWVASSATSTWTAADWAKVDCIQLKATGIAFNASVEMVIDAQADPNQTPLNEGQMDVWYPVYYQDFTNAAGQPFQGWYQGAAFGVQSALSGVKGRIFNDLNKNGTYDGASENMTISASDGWKIEVIRNSDSQVIQTITYGTDPDTACILPDGTYRVVDLLSGDGKYTLKVTNANATTWMFGPTATRAANPGDTIPDTSASPATGFQQNIFVSTDADVTATATVSAGWTDPSGADLEHRVSSEARYNIGVLGKADTTLTWQSADTTKGTVSGAGVTGSPAKKTLTDAPQTTLTAPQPEVTTTAGYTFTGWVRVTAGGIAPAWNATPTAGLTAAQVAASVNSPFGSGSGTYGYIDYDYYAVFEADSAPLGGVAKTIDGTDTVLNSTQEAISYHVLATLPAVTSNYETLTLEDQVPAVFEILSAGFSGDATGMGTVNIVNNKVTATITSDADFTALAGKVVDLVITVRLKPGTTSADNTTAPIVNTATVTPEYKSGTPDPTPPAITGPGVDINIPDPPSGFAKTIDGTDHTLNAADEQLVYHVKYTLPAATDLYSSVVVTDAVPTQFAIVSAAAVGDAAGKGTVLTTGNAISYTVSSAADLSALAGKTVDLAITVKAASGVVVASNIVNKASMEVTYKADVDDPPSDPGDASAPPVDIGIPTAPTGVAKTVDGTDTVLNSTQEAISYHVLATLPAVTSNYETLTLEDQVPAVFEILSVGFTGDATGMGTVNIANNKVTATITADADFTALAGKVVDLVITVRLKAGTTSADNTTAPIVNTATVTPEYKSGPQDPTPPAITGPGVDIDIPDPPANFSKSIDGTDYTLDSPSEELTYHVTFDIPSDTHLYSSITVTDNVPAALQIVTQAAVGDSAGMGTLTQSGNTITYTISSATELAALQGKTVNLAITVKSATGVTSAAAVKNKASMDVTYKTDVDDPPADPPDAEAPPIDVDIPTAPSGTVKTIDGTDKVLNSTTELLTYHVMTTLPAVTLDYETLTLEDEVPAAFEIVSAGFAGDAAGMGTVTIVNNKVTATITDDAEFAALTDAKVDLVITVRLAAGTTSANNTNTPIVNKGKVTVDYKTAPDPTPEEPEAPGVEINIPDPPTGFFKQIDGTDTQLNSATETLVYHIRYTLPADTSLYESVLVSDAVPAQLRIYNVSAVGAAAGRGQLTRSGNQVSYTISGGDLTALAGQTVDLAVTVGVADGVSVASNIINAASLDVTYKADVDDPPADPPTTYAPPVSVLQYYLVTFVNGFGAVLKIESVPYAGSATAPGNPAYPSYTFVGWDRSYSYITSNITVTARWSYVYVPPVVVPDPDPTPDPEPTPEPTPTAVTTSTTPTVTTPVTPVTDSANIGDEDTPRSVYLWNNHAWSLVSLILSCIAVVIAIILLVGGLTKRRRDEDYDEVSGAQNATTQQQEEREKQHRRGNLLRLLAIIIGILTPIVWLILDDLTLPMALFNVWTIIVAFVFLVHIIFTLLYNARKDKNRHNGEDYEYAQAR